MGKYIEKIKEAELITNYLKGEVSERQIEDLKLQNPQLAQLISNFKELNSITKIESKYSKFDADRSWKEVNKTINRKRILFLNIVRYASIIILPIVLLYSIYIVKPIEQNKVKKDFFTKIKTESKKAVLKLENGKEIKFDIKNNKLDLTNHFTKIKNGKLIVKADKTSKAKIKELYIPKGSDCELLLSDGTIVYLFSDTRIEYPSKFRGENRKVKIIGEAYFKVNHNKDRPFIVSTQNVDVRVLGTTFNVMAYPDKDYVEASLVEGSIMANNVKIKPNQQFQYNKITKEENIIKIDSYIYKERANGLFVFQNESLDHILKELSRWYKFDYKFSNDTVKQMRFGFKLPKYNNIKPIIELIQETQEVEFSLNGNTVIVN